MHLLEKSRQYKRSRDAWCHMSVQHQGKGTGGGCATSHKEHEAEDSSWVNNIQFRQLFLSIRGELSISILCPWMAATLVAEYLNSQAFWEFWFMIWADSDGVPGSLFPHKRAWVSRPTLDLTPSHNMKIIDLHISRHCTRTIPDTIYPSFVLNSLTLSESHLLCLIYEVY